MPTSSMVFFLLSIIAVLHKKPGEGEQMFGIFPLVFQCVSNLFVCHWEALCFSCWAPRQCDRYYDFGRVFLYSGSWIDNVGVSVLSPHFMLLGVGTVSCPLVSRSNGARVQFVTKKSSSRGGQGHSGVTHGTARVRIAQKQIRFWRWG